MNIGEFVLILAPLSSDGTHDTAWQRYYEYLTYFSMLGAQTDVKLYWIEEALHSKWFMYTHTVDIVAKAKVIDSTPFIKRIPMNERLMFLGAPVSLREDQLDYFSMIVSNVVNNKVTQAAVSSDYTSYRVDELETGYKDITLYLWFHYHFPVLVPDLEKASMARSMIVDAIIAKMANGLRQHCNKCGAVLPLKHSFNMCEHCFKNQRRR
jgi:hypothetical protein